MPLSEVKLVRTGRKGDKLPENYPFVSSVELRRAFMRERAEARNAPAEPTAARMTVGFSGESSQSPVVISPPWAWSGRAAAERKSAKPKSRKSFFMVSSFGKVT